jgi:hypothetical protein
MYVCIYLSVYLITEVEAQVLNTVGTTLQNSGVIRFKADALGAWNSMNPIVNLNIQFVADLRRTPTRNFFLLTPQIPGHIQVFDKAWTTLNIFYAGNLLVEDGHWKHIEDFHIERCTKSDHP